MQYSQNTVHCTKHRGFSTTKRGRGRNTVYLNMCGKQFLLRKSVSNNYMKAKCVHCMREFSVSHGGGSDMKQHTSTAFIKI
jgi:hypothetical protein